jgi:uncharacterized membrane protein YdjX (TVP38/TMEM64 family)
VGVIENAVTLIISIMRLSVGAVIAFLVARYYYQRAAKDLEKEAKELRRLTTLILRGWRKPGWLT